MNKKLDQQRIKAISDLGRQVSDTTILMHEAIARSAGLSGTDHKYLGLLIQNGPMTAGDLSKLTGLTTGAVTGLIDRFEKKKLARREFNENDRRKIVIVPDTENAMKLLGSSFIELQNKMVDLMSSLEDSEIKIIENYLLETIKIMKEVTSNLNKK